MKHDYQFLDSFKVPPNFRGRSAFIVQLWWIVESTLFAMSPQFMFAWRRFLLKIFGAKIGKNVKIRSTVRCTYPWKIKIGDHSWIGDDVVLYSLCDLEIGESVVISQKSYICTATHDQSKTTFDQIGKKVIIEDQVWIATDVFIAPGVTVGRGAVVGARSNVFSDIPSGTLSYGSPASVVRQRI